MKHDSRWTLFAVSAGIFAGCAPAGARAPMPLADAAIRDAAGAQIGTVRIARTDAGARLTVAVRGFTPGMHGIHLHQTGRCDAPAFTTAGGHWNPSERQHGLENPVGPHAGDLPNLNVATNGTGTLEAVVSGDMYDADGIALVIHAGADDQHTDPSGSSGARVACAVLSAPRA